MKRLQRDMESLVKQLKKLTDKAEKMSAELDKLKGVEAKPAAKGRPRKKAAAGKKPAAKRGRKKLTATDTVLKIVERSSKGVNTAKLKTKTGYNDAKVRSIVFRLKKAGKIQAISKGLYEKA